jgi:hypothetical protein
MFVRFRQSERRLQASLVETHRIGGKVRHEHIASFGSVEMPLSVEGRIAFWQRLHERLAKLSNRVDAAAQAKILGDVHARIPMVTLDEQRALQLENAKADEQFWSNLHDVHAGTVEDHRGLARTVANAVAAGQAEMAKTAEARDAAKARRERLPRGEDVGEGFRKAHTYEDAIRIFREAGFSDGDIRYMDDLAALSETELPKIVAARQKAAKRAERAAVRTLLRRRREMVAAVIRSSIGDEKFDALSETEYQQLAEQVGEALAEQQRTKGPVDA